LIGVEYIILDQWWHQRVIVFLVVVTEIIAFMIEFHSSTCFVMFS